MNIEPNWGLRSWRTFDLGFGFYIWRDSGFDCWISLGWVYFGAEVWRD